MLESVGNGYWIDSEFETAGYKLLLTNTAKAGLIMGNVIKTDVNPNRG